MKKFFIPIVMVLFLSACSESSDSSVSNVGSNGLPVSMSAFPDISIIKGVDGKAPKIIVVNISATIDYKTSAAYQRNLVYHGFIKGYSTPTDSQYIKDNVSGSIFTLSIDGHVFNVAAIGMTEIDNGIDISKVYSYFQPVLKDSYCIWFNFVDLDVTALDAYVSILEKIGFQRNSVDWYIYNNYAFAYACGGQPGSCSITFLANPPYQPQVGD